MQLRSSQNNMSSSIDTRSPTRTDSPTLIGQAHTKQGGQDTDQLLDRCPGSGSLTREECKRDQGQGSFHDEVPGTSYIAARTTIKSDNIRDDSTVQASEPDRTLRHVAKDRTEEQRYERYWELHHGFGFSQVEPGFDEVDAGLRVDPDKRDRYRLCDAVLHQLEVPDPLRETALQRTLRGEDGNFNWNRWYAGAIGLAIAHALVEMFDSPNDMRENAIWDDIVRVCDGLPTQKEYPVSQARTVSADRLIERAFENLGKGGGDA